MKCIIKPNYILNPHSLFSSILTFSPDALKPLARKGGDYDLFTFVTHPGGGGVAFGGVACDTDKGQRINFNSAYGANECNGYNPPKPIDCTTTNRIMLTAEVSTDVLGSIT